MALRREQAKIKILFISPTGTLSSGGEKSNYQLITYLIKNNFKVKVITSFRGDYNKTLTKSGIDNRPGNYNWWTDRRWDRPEVTSVRSLHGVGVIYDEIRKYDPAVVITNTLNIPWGALAAAMANKPHIWIAREFPRDSFAYLDKKLDFIKKISNRIAANSEELANFIAREYDCSVSRFYSFVDATKISLNPDITETRLISLNYVNDRKNQIELLKAVRILKQRKKLDDTKVLLVGGQDEVYTAKLQLFIKRNNLQNTVIFTGHQNNPWRLAGPNDVLIQTSFSESIGRTITEGMMLGVPVIASDIPGHKEAFRFGGGVLYKSGDALDLAEKIEETLNNLDLAKRRALKVKEKIQKTMTEDVCSGPMVKLIKGVIGEDNPMGELRHIAPYVLAFIKNHQQLQKDFNKLQIELNEARNLIHDLKNSTSYKTGNVIVRLIKKALFPLSLIKGTRL